MRNMYADALLVSLVNSARNNVCVCYVSDANWLVLLDVFAPSCDEIKGKTRTTLECIASTPPPLTSFQRKITIPTFQTRKEYSHSSIDSGGKHGSVCGTHHLSQYAPQRDALMRRNA